MLSVTLLSSGLLLPLTAGMTAFGAGALTEVSGGQSPRNGAAEGEPAFLTELQLAAGVRFKEKTRNTTFVYSPRLLYRPGIFDSERPLVLHQLMAAWQSAISRRLQLQFDVTSSLGEIEPRGAATQALGTSNTNFEARYISVFSTATSVGARYALDRLSLLNTAIQGGYRTSTSLPGIPGVSASSDDTLPESYDASLSVGYDRALSSRLSVLVPLRLGYIWSDTVGSIGTVGLESGVRYGLDRRTDLSAVAGAVYMRFLSRQLAEPRIVPSALLALSHTFDQVPGRTTAANISLRQDTAFDPLQGDLRPSLALASGLTLRRGYWSFSGSAMASVLTSRRLRPNESRTTFGGGVPVAYAVSDGVILTFGARASARAEEWPAGPFSLRQVEMLGFVGLRAAVSTEPDAGWVL